MAEGVEALKSRGVEAAGNWRGGGWLKSLKKSGTDPGKLTGRAEHVDPAESGNGIQLYGQPQAPTRARS